MSVKALVWAWNLKIKIASHKLVLLTLADNSNEQGECFPKLDTIAKRCGIAVRPLQKVISKLKESGYLETDSRHRKDGRQTSNIFYLNMIGKFPTIDEEEVPVQTGTTLSYRTPSPCPTGHPHPVLQDIPPLAQNTIFDNENNKLQNVQNQQLKGLTKKITKDKILCASDDAPTRFDDFWNIYPRKKNKIRSRKIWERKKYDKIADLICEDVTNRIENEHQWQDPQYIPHPETYLNNERWTDDVTYRITKTSGGGKSSAFSEFINGSDQSGATYDEHGNAINPFN